MYSIGAIIILVPLYFSHILAPFGVIIGNTSSFERQKVYLFLFFVALGIGEYLWKTYIKDNEKHVRETNTLSHTRVFWIWMSGIILIPWISSFYFGTFNELYWIIGSWEKIHGYIFWIGVSIYTFLVSQLTKESIINLLRLSLGTAGIIGCICVYEACFGSPFFAEQGIVSWESGRIIGTLGNPNYLAGYILMHIPLISYIRKSYRIPVFCIYLLSIVASGSYIAMGLIGIYGLFLIIDRWRMRYILPISFIFCLGTIISIITLGESMIGTDKFLSLISRFVLMKDTLTHMVQYPVSFLIGFGPDSIITYYSQYRSTLIQSYFPSTFAIDSSHNLWLDLLFQFGLLGLIPILIFLSFRQKIQRQSGVYLSCLLGIVFLGLNVMIISHLILLIPTYIAIWNLGNPVKSSPERKQLNP